MKQIRRAASNAKGNSEVLASLLATLDKLEDSDYEAQLTQAEFINLDLAMTVLKERAMTEESDSDYDDDA